MKKTLILLIATVMVLSVLTSCKKNSSADSEPAVVGVRVGNIATSFTETDSQGDSFTLESLRGNVILLNFSAMWCTPCRAEAIHLMDLYNTYHQNGLEIVQCIYQDEDGNPTDASDIGRWIQEYGITYTVITDPDRSSVDTYEFTAIPFNAIIDRDFVIHYVSQGFDIDTVIRNIENLL